MRSQVAMGNRSGISAKLALFGFTIRQSLTERKIWLVAVLVLMPAVIAGLIRTTATDWHNPVQWQQYHRLVQGLVFAGAIPLMCLLFGPAIMGAEADAGTLAYLLTRRMRRATVFVVRFFAVVLVLTGLSFVSILACHLAAVGGASAEALEWMAPLWAPHREAVQYMAVAGPAVAAFLGVFTVVSLITSRTLIASAMYLITVEVFLANLPMAAQAYTITHQVRKTICAAIPNTTAIHDSLPPALVDKLYGSGESGLMALAIVVGILVAAGCGLVTYRELVPTTVARD